MSSAFGSPCPIRTECLHRASEPQSGSTESGVGPSRPAGVQEIGPP
ncbi:MAG: hypothetical protein LBQ12_09705 [Deltaproteobacteria bacterium]|nr:hypothetical protein [Deltaproteobacteria bacterium]